MKQTLSHHPLITADQRTIQSGQYDVALAKQQFKPGWNLDVSYSYRQARDRDDDTKRPDFIGAQMNIDLPIFPRNRQSRTLNANIANLNAKQAMRHKDYLELNRQLTQAHSNWLLLNKRIALYKNSLIPKAKTYAKSTLIAYCCQ